MDCARQGDGRVLVAFDPIKLSLFRGTIVLGLVQA